MKGYLNNAAIWTIELASIAAWIYVCAVLWSALP
jgi:hypothetical protein